MAFKIISIVIILLLIFFILFILYKSENKIKQIRKEYKEKQKIQIDNAFKEQYKEKIDELNRITTIIAEQKRNSEEIKKTNEEQLIKYFEEKRKNKKKEIDDELAAWEYSRQDALNFRAQAEERTYNQKKQTMERELSGLEAEVEDFRMQRQVINEEILRAREMEEKQDFYRIQIPESSQRDIQILNSVRPQLQKIDILDKLIYDNYIKKSVDEMEKRVLNGRAPSGIYKITRLKTGEIYIGKSTDVKARWQQHAKSVFHCGTISHSILHTTMERDGIWNYTFELLEEIPKEKLSEREKYWIQFYDSKKYGLNEKE